MAHPPPTPDRPTRRRLLGLAAAPATAAAGAALAAYGGAESRSGAPQALPPGEIEFWNHWADTSPGGIGWQAVADRFQAAHPGATVRRVLVPSGELYQKALAAAAAGTPPHLTDMNPASYPALVARGLLVRLDGHLKASGGLARSSLLPAVQETVTVDGGVYALPSEYGTQLLFYNADLLAASGLKEPEATWRYEAQFLDAARRATRADAPPDGQRFGVEHINNGWWDPRWRGVVWSFGGEVLSRDHKRCALGEAPALEALQYLADLKHRYRVTPTDEARQAAGNVFEAGKLAFLPSGSFYYAQLKQRATFKWGVAQLPGGRAGSRPATGGWLSGVGQGSKLQDVSWAFLAFSLQPEQYALFLKTVSWTPPIKAIERPPLVEDAGHWAAMTEAGQNARSLPSIAPLDEALRLVNEALKPVFDAGSVTARAAVQEVVPRVDALLAQPR